MKTNDGIPGFIFVKNEKYVISIKGKRYYTGLHVSKVNLKRATEIKRKLFFGELNFAEEEKKKNNDIYTLFNEFIGQIEVNRTDKTIQNHKLAFKKIITINYNVSLQNIEKSIIDFIKSNKNLKPVSVNTYLRHLQVFVNWLAENKHIEEQKNFKKKYYQKYIEEQKDYYTLEELDLIVNFIQNNNYQNKRILALIFKFLFYSGARITEALNIKKSDILEDKIKMSNKITKKIEYVYFNPKLFEVVEELKRLVNTNNLLYYKNTSYLKKVLYAALNELKIQKKGFHGFRRSYLAYLFYNNVPVQIASKLMRHSNVNITMQKYSNIKEDELVKWSSNLGTI